MSGFDEFTLDNSESHIREKATRFKVASGKSYRVSLVWWGDDPNYEDGAPKFIKAARYYREGLGYVIHDNDHNQEYRDLLKDRPRDVFATIIAVWPTIDGALDNNAFAAGKGFKVLPWIMSQDKISTLLRVHKNFGLGTVDLSITCPKGGGDFQKMEIMPINKSFRKINHGNLYRMIVESDKEAFQKMASKVQRLADSVSGDIRDQIGRQYTLNELREKLGLTVAGGDDATGADEVEEVLDNLVPY